MALGFSAELPCLPLTSVKNDKQYEGLRKKGMSKSRAAAISNSPGASSRGGKNSGKKKSGGKKSS